MKADKRDELEELFQNGLEDFEVEIQADLLSPVQSRLRFDRYVRGIITALVLGTIVFSSMIYYYPNFTGVEEGVKKQRQPKAFNLAKIDGKQLTQKAMVLETVNFNFTPVATHSINTLPNNDAGTELTHVGTSSHEQPADQEATQDSGKPVEAPLAIKNEYLAAEPVEGFAHLYAYIRRELIYPDPLRVERIMGTVQVGFAINKKGVVENVSIKSGVHSLLDQEARRVIEHMPQWYPAKIGDMPVRSQMTIPITFDVEEIDGAKD